MDLQELRGQIDDIDRQLVDLFCQRMEVSAEIADYKKKQGLPIYVPAREREKLADVLNLAGPDMANYTRVLYSTLFELSRSYQRKRNSQESSLLKQIRSSIKQTPIFLSSAPTIALPSAEETTGQVVCDKIFKAPKYMYFENNEGVFDAIQLGLCQYGIIPIEGSASDSVKEVYDLAILYNFSIVHSFRLVTEHNHIIRYICIGKNLEISPESDKTSIVITLANKPGSLYRVLARMYVLGINVTRLESKSIPGNDFEFVFYFDLETSVYSEGFTQLICELDELCVTFKYLGSYSEVE